MRYCTCHRHAHSDQLLRKFRNNLNNPLPRLIYTSVQLLKKIMVLALVTFWSLASNHCKLERLTAFEFLQCGDTETVTAHPESDCAADACASLEESIYKTEENQQLALAPLSAIIFSAAIADEYIPSPAQTLLVSASPPPELSVGWQFIFRTAALPRAPSFAS